MVNTQLAHNLTRQIGQSLFWPLTELDLLKRGRAWTKPSRYTSITDTADNANDASDVESANRLANYDDEDNSASDIAGGQLDGQFQTSNHYYRISGEEEEEDEQPENSFVCSKSTTIFDNLLNQTFTVVNSLKLSHYNDAGFDVAESSGSGPDSGNDADADDDAAASADPHHNDYEESHKTPLDDVSSSSRLGLLNMNDDAKDADRSAPTNGINDLLVAPPLTQSAGRQPNSAAVQYNLYACIVDADVRHNYATLGVNFRSTVATAAAAAAGAPRRSSVVPLARQLRLRRRQYHRRNYRQDRLRRRRRENISRNKNQDAFMDLTDPIDSETEVQQSLRNRRMILVGSQQRLLDAATADDESRRKMYAALTGSAPAGAGPSRGYNQIRKNHLSCKYYYCF